MAGKDKGARIWVRDLESGEKNRNGGKGVLDGKKLKITMNTRTSHGHTVEGYSDLILLFNDFSYLKLQRFSVLGT